MGRKAFNPITVFGAVLVASGVLAVPGAAEQMFAFSMMSQASAGEVAVVAPETGFGPAVAVGLLAMVAGILLTRRSRFKFH